MDDEEEDDEDCEVEDEREVDEDELELEEEWGVGLAGTFMARPSIASVLYAPTQCIVYQYSITTTRMHQYRRYIAASDKTSGVLI